MPRALRTQVAGATYHVTAHAVAGTKLFRKDIDRRRLLAEMTSVVDTYGWICLAACLLDNHYHLLVTTPEPNLARGMQRLNGSYAAFFNNKYRRKGHLFGSRYYSLCIESEGHLLNTFRYIAWNAAAADPSLHSRADRWNSYPGVVGRCGVLAVHCAAGGTASTSVPSPQQWPCSRTSSRVRARRRNSKPGSDPGFSGHGEKGLFVDPVAAEVVELRVEELAR